LKVYKRRQIREVLIHEGYAELIGADEYTLYFLDKQGAIIANLNDEIFYKPQITLICESMGKTFEQFEDLYKKAKNHQF
jgi:hypothetical protein